MLVKRPSGRSTQSRENCGSIDICGVSSTRAAEGRLGAGPSAAKKLPRPNDSHPDTLRCGPSWYEVLSSGSRTHPPERSRPKAIKNGSSRNS